MKAYNDAYATAQKTFDDAIAPAFRQILMAAVRAPRKGKRVRR